MVQFKRSPTYNPTTYCGTVQVRTNIKPHSLLWYSSNADQHKTPQRTVVQFKRGPTYNPTMYCGYINFVLIALFFMTHKTLNPFFFQHQYFLCNLSSLVSWLKEKVYIPNWILWCSGTFPPPHLTNSSRNEQICYIQVCKPKEKTASTLLNPLNTELNSICHLLALLGAHHILLVSRIRVKYGDEKPNIKYNIQNPAHGKLEQWLSATLPPTMQNCISE